MQRRRERSRYVMDIPRPCIFGGRGDHWRLVVQFCSLNWWTTPQAIRSFFQRTSARKKNAKRLFGIIEELVKWENSTNDEVLERARAEIRASCGGELPAVYDPFSREVAQFRWRRNG